MERVFFTAINQDATFRGNGIVWKYDADSSCVCVEHIYTGKKNESLQFHKSSE